MICGTNKLLAILEAADEMNMMKKALPFCKQMGSAFLMLVLVGLVKGADRVVREMFGM